MGAVIGRTYYRPYYLGGLPQTALINTGQGWTITPLWSARILAWLQLLQDGGWAIQIWTRDSPVFPIEGMVSVNGGFYNYALPDGGGVVPTPVPQLSLAVVDGLPLPQSTNPGDFQGYTVRIGRARWSTRPGRADRLANGEFLLWSVAGPNVNYQGPLPSMGSYQGNGYLQVRQRSYAAIGSSSFVTQRIRKLGPAKPYAGIDRKSTRLNSSHATLSRMPSSA